MADDGVAREGQYTAIRLKFMPNPSWVLLVRKAISRDWLNPTIPFVAREPVVLDAGGYGHGKAGAESKIGARGK